LYFLLLGAAAAIDAVLMINAGEIWKKDLIQNVKKLLVSVLL